MALLEPEERIGTVLAEKYELREILGEGGMGVVFGGVHKWTGREVAVKLLQPHYAKKADIVRRFLQEARTASKITHPHVVEVLDMGQDADGSVYMVLERLRGEPLGALLRRRERLPAEEAIALLGPVMDAIAAVHDQGVVHRDLKPDNIFLCEGPEGTHPKLLDFGIAKVIEGTHHGGTQTGTTVGTAWYMSPEQVLADKDLGPPSDVWSMAVVLYEALSGARPFAAANPTAAMTLIASRPHRPLADAAPELSPTVRHPIEACLRKEPKERPTMRQLAAALRAAVGQSTRADSSVDLAWATPTRQGPTPARWAAMAAILLLMAGLGVGIGLSLPWGEEAASEGAASEAPPSEAGAPPSEASAPPSEASEGAGVAEGPEGPPGAGEEAGGAEASPEEVAEPSPGTEPSASGGASARHRGGHGRRERSEPSEPAAQGREEEPGARGGEERAGAERAGGAERGANGSFIVE